METDRLRQFKTVVDSGGLLRAAELLGISAGGLSKSLKVLEQELGYSLFQQKGRGLELTSMGQKLYERLPAVLRTVDDLLKLKPARAGETTIRIASSEVFTTYFLASLAAGPLRDQTIDAREGTPGRLEAMVADGVSDIGLTYLPVPTAGVEFVKIGRIRMAVYGRAGAFGSSDILELPFAIPIAPLEGMPTGAKGLDGWPEHLFERKVRYRVEMMESAIQLCHAGAAVAFVPEFVARLVNAGARPELALAELPLPRDFGSVHRDVFLVHRRGYEETRVIKAIAKAVRGL